MKHAAYFLLMFSAVFACPAIADRMQNRMNAGIKRFDARVDRIDAMIAEQKRKLQQKPGSVPSQPASDGSRK